MKNLNNNTVAQIENYIILNLAVETLSHTRRIKRYSFLSRRWKSKDQKVDDVADFFVEKRSLILEAIACGFSIGSFELEFCPITNTIINSFINWMINGYKSKGEKQQRFENKMRSLDDKRIEKLIECLECKMKVVNDRLDLTVEEKVLMLWHAGEFSTEEALQKLSLKTRKSLYDRWDNLVKKIKLGAK